MVLNQKIIDRKVAAINHIIDQDGGCNFIEVYGILKLIEINYTEKLKALGALPEPTEMPPNYKELKARHIARLKK